MFLGLFLHGQMYVPLKIHILELNPEDDGVKKLIILESDWIIIAPTSWMG